jgi:hypothetical protein
LNREIKTTLALDGEKEFKKGLDDAARNMRILSSESKAVTSAFSNNKNSVEALTAKNQILNKQIDQQEEIVRALSRAVNDSTQKYGEADKRTDGYRIQLNNATTALNNMKTELNNNENELKDMAVAEDNAGKQASQLGDEIKGAGNKAKSFKGQIKDFASSSIGQFASITAAAALFKEAFQAIDRLMSESAQWADDLTTFSKVVSINTQDLQKLSYTSKFVDVDVEVMSKGMQKLTKSMYEAHSGNKDLNEILKDQLGIDYEVNGQLRDKNEVFLDVIDALGKMTNETERDALAQKLMGRSAAELNPLIVAGKDALKKYGDEAVTMGAVVDRGTIAVLNRLQDKTDQVSAVTEANGRRLAAAFAPVKTALDDLWLSAMKSIDPMEKLKDALLAQGLTSEQAGAAVDQVYRLQEAYNVMGLSQDEFLAKAKELMQYYYDQGIPADQAKAKAVEDLANGMDLAAVKTQIVMEKQAELSAATQTALDEYTAKKEEFEKALASTADKYLSDMGGIFDAFDVKINTSKKNLDKIGDDLQENLDDQVEGFQVWSDEIGKLSKKGVDDGLIAELRLMGTKAIPEIQALNNKTDTELNHYVETWRTKQKLAKDEALKELEPMKQEMVVKLKAVEEAVSAEEKYFKEAGKDLGGGVADGITESTDEIKSAAVTAAKKALEEAKDYLGIHSHSTRARDEIGKNMGGGVADGFVLSIEKMLPEMKKSLFAAIDTLQSETAPSRGQNYTSYNNSRTYTIKQTNHFTNYKPRDGAAAVRDLNRQLGWAY